MLTTGSSEFNQVGSGVGAGGLGFGGMGGFGLVGLFGLLNQGRRGGGGLFGGGGDDGGDGNGIAQAAILTAISNAKDATVAEGRALSAAICDAEKTNLQQFYASAIQAGNNTQAIKDQATAFAIVNDKRFDDLAAAGVLQTATILAKINQTEIDNLRDELAETRRGRDRDGIEISINNSNAQSQAQAQLQLQSQNYEISRRFDILANQINRNSQDVINFGTMAASGNQANQQTNVK